MTPADFEARAPPVVGAGGLELYNSAISRSGEGDLMKPVAEPIVRSAMKQFARVMAAANAAHIERQPPQF
jgi:hypothetical protein